jgi:hypothetical protein
MAKKVTPSKISKSKKKVSNESQISEVVLENSLILKRVFPKRFKAMRSAYLTRIFMFVLSVVGLGITFAHPIIGPIFIAISLPLYFSHGRRAERLRSEMLDEIGLDENGAVVDPNPFATGPGVEKAPSSPSRRIRKY